MQTTAATGTERRKLSGPVFEGLLIGLAACSVAAIIAAAPFEVLIDRFVPDDAFYYYQPAKNLVETGRSSFDGLNYTNGYQPLWFLVSALVTAAAGSGALLVRIMTALCAIFAVTACVVWFQVLRRRASFGICALGMALCFRYLDSMINGLETALMLTLFAACVRVYAAHTEDGYFEGKISVKVLFGVLLGLTFWARTDFGLFIVMLFCWLGVGGFRRGRLLSDMRECLPIAAPMTLIIGTYLAYNFAVTGHLMPVSGAAKQFHSMMAREASIRQTGVFVTYAGNLGWAFLPGGNRIVALALVLPVFNWGVAWVFGLRRVRAEMAVFLPFFAGAWLIYLVYAVMFYGTFTRTIWYYGPHYLLAGLALVQGGRILQALWPGSSRFSRPSTAKAFGVAVIILAAGFHCHENRQQLRIPAGHWNYNLLRGAYWAKAHLPKDATIWSGSSGILAYFSEHRVVNTDGLANSYEFLEQYLKPGKLHEYVRQFDYAIDAYADERLKIEFPQGCFVASPEELGARPFSDGAYTRQLGVFQMKPGGVVSCQ